MSDIESNANQVILLKERKLYRMDTVSNICKMLDGKVYECVMEDRAFDAFQDTHLILSVRQEQEHMQVRYYSSKPEEGSRNCTPNLEENGAELKKLFKKALDKNKWVIHDGIVSN